MLLGAGATRAAFLREIDTHPVLHFAGHAVFDDESPDASYLVLAPGNSGDSDRLYVRELAGARFRRLRLVVLSACSSIAPAPGRGGGLWGLAQPFLARGAVDVVGSVWPVDDRPVAALMTAFHAALLRGAEPAVALQEAQRMALASSDPALASPAAWAAFVVLGG
jgi:CHAT domain-containing protein